MEILAKTDNGQKSMTIFVKKTLIMYVWQSPKYSYCQQVYQKINFNKIIFLEPFEHFQESHFLKKKLQADASETYF